MKLPREDQAAVYAALMVLRHDKMTSALSEAIGLSEERVSMMFTDLAMKELIGLPHEYRLALGNLAIDSMSAEKTGEDKPDIGAVAKGGDILITDSGITRLPKEAS